MLRKILLGFFITFGALSLLSPLAIYILSIKINNIDKLKELGPLGDFIGGSITPFLTFASFIVLIYSLWEERYNTQLQTFNSNLLQIITLYHETIKNIRFVNDGKEFFGLEFFDYLYVKQTEALASQTKIKKLTNEQHEVILNYLEKEAFGFKREIFQYINMVGYLVNYIKNSNVRDLIKKNAFDLIFANFSKMELVCLQYICNSETLKILNNYGYQMLIDDYVI